MMKKKHYLYNYINILAIILVYCSVEWTGLFNCLHFKVSQVEHFSKRNYYNQKWKRPNKLGKFITTCTTNNMAIYDQIHSNICQLRAHIHTHSYTFSYTNTLEYTQIVFGTDVIWCIVSSSSCTTTATIVHWLFKCITT